MNRYVEYGYIYLEFNDISKAKFGSDVKYRAIYLQYRTVTIKYKPKKYYIGLYIKIPDFI